MLELYLIPMGRSLVYVLEVFVLLWIARMAYGAVFRGVDLKAEIFARNNHAAAIAQTGYLMGIVIALGGGLSGPSAGWGVDMLSIAAYGLVSIVLMLVAGFVCDWVLLHRFDNTKEIIEDQNIGTAFVEAGIHIANGLILLGLMQGSGPWWSGLAFWVLAQGALVLTGRLYEIATPHGVQTELERDNAAVGLAFGGALVGMGNIVSLAALGTFTGWRDSLTSFAFDTVFGLVFLFIIKKTTDWVMAPGIRLGDEQVEDPPNIGAGLIEALGYVGGSFLVLWIF